MIYFTKVRWKNLLSTGNAFTEIDLRNAHTTILLGESGSGKSTFLDAITFALFNKPFRGINLPKLVNSINERNCVVEIEFKASGKEYLIRRGIGPKIFEIWCDGELVNQEANARDYQADLEKKILKFNFKAFTQIVVLGAAGFVPFMQLKPSDRRIVIEGLLDIEIFSIMNKILTRGMANVKQEIVLNEQNIVLAKEKIFLHEKYLREQIADKEAKIVEHEAILVENKSQMTKIEKQIEKLKEEVSFIEEKLVFRTAVSAKLEELGKIQRALNERAHRLEKEISFFSEHNDCPTCHQLIAEDFKQTQVNEKRTKLTKIGDGLIQTTTKITEQSDRLSEARELEKQTSDLNTEINKHANSIDAIQRYISKITKELEDLKTKKNPQTADNSEIVKLNKEIEALHKTKEKLAMDRTIHEISTNLLKDGGVKAKIIKQYLPLINKYTNTFLHKMNFFVTFSINEEFDESIKSRGRDPFSYANFSEGEKQRIDLALLFTWRTIAKLKNSVNTNLLIMDEVLDSYLDNSATENVLQLLSSDLFCDTNIFVISHKETITDKFDANIRFVKKKNFSIISNKEQYE